MYIGWRKLLIVAVLLGAGGMLFAWSGILHVGASGGHWAITDWFLHWVMRNSVKTYSVGIETPDLSNPGLVHRAAGHFQTGCAPCHGAPGEPQNPVMQSSTPPPPTLYAINEKWQPQHLFWIVKHGIKFTGMPAWVAQGRDDEAWSMVAFLRALPAMSAEQYRDLAFGEIEIMPVQGDRLDVLLADCARCHGRDGAGRDNDAFPLIGGQSEAYLTDALRAFAAGRRHSGIMRPAAARGSESELALLARHYASQRSAATGIALNPAFVTDGARLATEGAAERGVPACLTCHGGDARQRNPRFPNLDGQHASYLATQLRAWQQDARGGGPYAHLMATIAERMTEQDIEAAAAYFASRAAGR